VEKFNRTLHGYDPEEVNAFLDQVINHVEKMIGDMKAKDARIKELETALKNVAPLKDKVDHYEKMEDTLNKAIIMAQKTSDQIKSNAYHESEMIVDEAKKNANRIVNEALLKAEKIETNTLALQRNANIFKRRLKQIIEEQLEMVNDLEKVEF
jgi:cell division initiation protein